MAHVLVAGAGGFIGGHLARRLLDEGHQVRAVDVRPIATWHQVHPAATNTVLDLRRLDDCTTAVRGIDEVYNFAADMGGMGFIERERALCMLNVLINTHLLLAARDAGVARYFFASSACVYRDDLQGSPDVVPLAEGDAYPAMPEDGYGWEKLFGERMCRHFTEDFGLETRAARFHNVYGPHGTFEGGREKAPAAICRKVAQAKLSGAGEIDVWGDGKQTRSFTWIEDAVRGTRLLMDSAVREPLNVGSSELVTVDGLIDIVERIAGIRVKRRYDTSAPQGVRGRNSDNTLIQQRLGWQPSTRLEAGLESTYRWIHDRLASRRPAGAQPPAVARSA